MLKNDSKKDKTADMDYSDDYCALAEGITNPYGYSFGRISRHGTYQDFKRLEQRINVDYFYKK